MKAMQSRCHKTTIDDEAEAMESEWRGKRPPMMTANEKARCNWAGFRHGLAQWNRWKLVLAMPVVDDRRRQRVMESQMAMRVMRRRALLGNKWQIIKAKVQDEEEP